MTERTMGAIDRLELTVLIENSPTYDTYLEGCFGLSLWLDMWRQGARRRVLFDVGPRADTLERNARSLGIDLSAVDAIVLSHCHFDHTAALAGLLKMLGRPVPVFGHPDLFRPNFVLAPEFMDYAMNGENSRANLENAGARFVLSVSPMEPYPGLMLTGEVEHSTPFEESGGVSCFTTDADGRLIPDRLQDDVSAVVNVEGVGGIVLSGCSHAGVVNIVKQAKALSGDAGIAAIIGGFHLLQATPKRTVQTIDAFKELAPQLKVLSPMHCTGLKPSAMMADAFGEAFRELHVGDRVVFASTR
jgi:7,8-dihydropterin-6-yl-methyl-4-(beta-D-ribofuranosyl)aminobenzene 5'-phosphate synthase